ncbi:MAG: hypothetical protein LC798_10745 [Chloroflexi bacterium]|nr:hypothetical protein [Chloroflexota bacterium]
MTKTTAWFDPLKGERIKPAWLELLNTLADDDWHPWTELVHAMTAVSDIKTTTASNLIHNGVKAGILQRKGKYRTTRPTHTDTRLVRLTDAGHDMTASQLAASP